MPIGFREFEFDLPGALLEQLVAVFGSLNAAPLDNHHLADIPEEQGVYQIFLDETLVYIGKTDAEAGLFRRLSRHARKIQSRIGLAPERVSFKAVRIFVFTAVDLETQLIGHYGRDPSISWNGSGFGANDPGRERDTSKPGRFDSQFPIDIDLPLNIDLEGRLTAAEIIGRLKAAIPYACRVQSFGGRLRKPHQEICETEVEIPASAVSAREILTVLTTQLPPGWQATALSSLLILYKEERDNYPGAVVLARS